MQHQQATAPSGETNGAAKNHYDTAIVGGGVSGIYTGWRLVGADGAPGDPPPQTGDVGVFERSYRIGGRLDTLVPPGAPNLRAEIGGMRYITSQRRVTALVENALGLPYKPFYTDGPDHQNINFLRGHHFRNTEYSDAARIPFFLPWDEQGLDPAQLIAKAVGTIVPDAVNLTPDQWECVQQRGTIRHPFGPPEGYEPDSESEDDVPFYQLGFWNILSRALSMEGYKLAVEGGGYDLTLANWNAAAAMPWYLGDFNDPVYRTPVDGYMAVPTTLRTQFEAAGGHVNLGHELIGLNYNKGPHNFTLTFRVTREGQEPETIYVTADKVVLAMPRRSLEIIAKNTPLLQHAPVQELMRSVKPVPMLKIFCCYSTPWWKRVGVDRGKSNTDLPLRQCYYFGTVNEQDPVPPGEEANTNSLLMASYEDGRNVGFWAGLRAKDKHAGTFDLTHEPVGDEAWQEHAAPRRMVQEVQRQLATLHGMKYVPEPYTAAYQYWGDDPYGGAVNYWKVGVKPWEVQEQMLQPLQDVAGCQEVPLFVCGEAYSSEQGWVEGALATAEAMLEQKFNLPSPVWLPPEATSPVLRTKTPEAPATARPYGMPMTRAEKGA